MYLPVCSTPPPIVKNNIDKGIIISIFENLYVYMLFNFNEIIKGIIENIKGNNPFDNPL